MVMNHTETFSRRPRVHADSEVNNVDMEYDVYSLTVSKKGFFNKIEEKFT
jgi:hypothetical protein